MIKRAIFIIFLFLSGCFPLTSNSLKKLSVNDTEEQVIKTLGKPFSKKVYYNKVFLIYYIHDDFFSIFFNLKKFPFIGFYPLLRTGDEYWIIMEDNKLVSFGSAKNFGNNIPRALNDKGATLTLGAE